MREHHGLQPTCLRASSQSDAPGDQDSDMQNGMQPHDGLANGPDARYTSFQQRQAYDFPMTADAAGICYGRHSAQASLAWPSGQHCDTQQSLLVRDVNALRAASPASQCSTAMEAACGSSHGEFGEVDLKRSLTRPADSITYESLRQACSRVRLDSQLRIERSQEHNDVELRPRPEPPQTWHKQRAQQKSRGWEMSTSRQEASKNPQQTGDHR